TGTGAEVLDLDTGTHTDPVAGGTVANAGRYSWSASPAGWRRIGETGLSGKVAATGSTLTDLFALAEWSPGYLAIATGGVVNDGSGNWEMSQLMRMEAGVSLIFDISAHSAVAHIACYTAAGAYISGQAGTGGNPSPRQGTFVTPAGTGLIRLSRASAIHPVTAARNYPNSARGPVPVTRYSMAAPPTLAGSRDSSCRKIRRRPVLNAASKIILYGDSRFSTDYGFAKTAFETLTGASVYNGGFQGQSAANTALNSRLSRIWTYDPDVIIYLPGGNDDGAPGTVGTFDGSVSGESIVTPTNIAADYSGTRFIQAVDHTVRKILGNYANIRARAGLTGTETEAEKTAKIDALRKPILILCTDLPQKRSSGTYWSLSGSWQRKRDAIAEVGRRNNVHTVDLLGDLAWDMSPEPSWTSPSDLVTNNGVWTMDGLHPNKYGHEQIAQLICGDAGLL
ncbi:SGNH/GDSL hydrolase family protein, partial [Pseudogemmobacter humi]|uniref:SGNH/GDSL hydrolase family protein n=1 Tax=Pseudogemmobacter humi TaxID=2483812 RepID=UPI0011CDA7C6